ncbi:MAG: hypothetical protein BYD32DRAFT_416209 [Podila humilis]|nr:MAG: hypothetical protein BYD32DRAFT_416209 [Podila humilis]
MKLTLPLLIFAITAAESVHAAPTSDIYFNLYTLANTDQCLGAEGSGAGGTESGKSPIFWSCKGSPGDNAKWAYDEETGHLTTKAAPGQCLSSSGPGSAGTGNGDSPIFLSCADVGDNANWGIDDVGNIYNTASPEQCLGSRGNNAAGTENGKSPIFWSCEGSPGDNAVWGTL